MKNYHSFQVKWAGLCLCSYVLSQVPVQPSLRQDMLFDPINLVQTDCQYPPVADQYPPITLSK